MTRMRPGPPICSILLACTLLGATPTPCLAQDQPVQPGVADIDPLGESFRLLAPVLRIDNNFEHVYRLNPDDEHSPFFRRAGGLYAVFPRSQYVLTRQGVVAAVPPGTIYHFGRPEPAAISGASADHPDSISGGRLRQSGASDQRLVGRQSPGAVTPNRLDRTAPPAHERDLEPRLIADNPEADHTETALLVAPRQEGVMSDRAYRVRRLAQIANRYAPRG